MAHSRGAFRDYMEIRTVPALLSVAAVMAALYSFGGIDAFTLTWFDYTVTTEHALIVSLVSYVVAFASSETKRFENYELWEELLIAAGIAGVLGNEYYQPVTDWVTNSDPVGGVALFVIFFAGWVVAVR